MAKKIIWFPPIELYGHLDKDCDCIKKNTHHILQSDKCSCIKIICYVGHLCRRTFFVSTNLFAAFAHTKIHYLMNTDILNTSRAKKKYNLTHKEELFTPPHLLMQCVLINLSNVVKMPLQNVDNRVVLEPFIVCNWFILGVHTNVTHITLPSLEWSSSMILRKTLHHSR